MRTIKMARNFEKFIILFMFTDNGRSLALLWGSISREKFIIDTPLNDYVLKITMSKQNWHLSNNIPD
jgi:hypothetical protein